MNQDAFLTIKGAAERCGVTPGTIRNWVKKGKIAYHQDPTSKVYWIAPKEFDRLRNEFQQEKQNAAPSDVGSAHPARQTPLRKAGQGKKGQNDDQ